MFRDRELTHEWKPEDDSYEGRLIRHFVYRTYPNMPEGDIREEAGNVRIIFPQWRGSIYVHFQNEENLRRVQAIELKTVFEYADKVANHFSLMAERYESSVPGKFVRLANYWSAVANIIREAAQGTQ